MTVEFACADCGRHIFAFGHDTPPSDGRCSLCRWIVDCIPSEEQPAVRERFDVRLLHLGQ